MNDNIVPNPWIEWKKQQEVRERLDRVRMMSGHRKQDFDLIIRELSKLKGSLDENEKRFINRLVRYNMLDELTKDEVKYLAKTYHALRKEYAYHEERCPVCKGQITLE
jgi:hypothetical protein